MNNGINKLILVCPHCGQQITIYFGTTDNVLIAWSEDDIIKTELLKGGDENEQSPKNKSPMS